MSKMMTGSPLLFGDNDIPGLKVHKEVAELMPRIEEICQGMGLDYYPVVLEFVTYDEMAEIASYGGFPVRYPHWKWGMSYEEMARGYEHNQYRISEMVINTNPCYIYCMDSNTLVDNVDVICHAIGHNDFFKNNVYFGPTNENMMNKLANHGTRIREYYARWGDEVVTEFIDHVLRIDTLINPANAWLEKKINKSYLKDSRKYHQPKKLKVTHNYMDEWVNNKRYMNRQKEKIRKREAADYLNMIPAPVRDVMAYLKNHAPLKLWQQDIISMLYEESMYFQPQRQTKMINEGWASYVDFHLLCREGHVALGQETHDSGIWHYAEHKMRVLGGQWSQNPYKLGFELLLDIEERWDKGKFGDEWDQCSDMREKENWDKKLGLGKDKVMEVRQFYNDYTLIKEFFTREFCEKMQYYEVQRFPDGDTKITTREFNAIKDHLLKRYLNGGLPDIRMTDPNHLGQGVFFLQHYSDGRPLYDKYARETICSAYYLWKKPVVLATQTPDGEEYVYRCGSQNVEEVEVLEREEYEKIYMR